MSIAVPMRSHVPLPGALPDEGAGAAQHPAADAVAAPALACSVIVPVHNNARTLIRCLDGFAGQRAGTPAFELIVVDAASTDDSVALARLWQQRHPTIKLRLLTLDSAQLAAARNTGAQGALGPVLLFTEADCVPGATWVAEMLAPFGDAAVAGVKGSFSTEQQSLIPRFVQAEYEDRYDRMARRAQIDFIDNYAAAYRRTVFLANGGFDANFAACEDQELSFRLAAKGYRMLFVPAGVVTHIHDTTLREYVQRKYIQGFWKAPLTQLHPERMVEDAHTPQVLKVQIVLAALLAGMLPLVGLGLVWPVFDWLWLAVLALAGAFVLTTAPFLAKLAQRSWGLALAGVPILLARALSLGLGYLYGTVHFSGTLPGARRPLIPGWKRFIKRAMDIAGALVGLVLTLPFVAVAALAIKWDSPGPVFFYQVRIGENGHPFRIVKLRTMTQDAEQRLAALVDFNELAANPAFKLADDPRVTRVGRFLRRTSLDEAPQFYNVLIGDMSLVGPRPEEARVVALYSDYHRQRLAVKPGLTGPMQVAGRGDLAFAERLQLELDYIEHYSLRRDLAILLRTVPVLFQAKGAR